jgi:excisionase family DNA binding protein
MNNVMTVPELAKYLRVHPSTIYRLLKRGDIPAFKVGADWRVNRESINKWLRQQEGVLHTVTKPVRVDGGG